MSNGFIAPGEEFPEAGVEAELEALTKQTYDLPQITRGIYILNEDDLPETYKELLHGRAYVKDSETITEDSAISPRTYYIAADKVQGLIVPARSMFIEVKNGDIKYKWTDNGEQWTDWISLETGISDDYPPQNKNRFAEVQVYKTSGTPVINIIASR